ncbi:hypothetical protein D2E97_00530 [Mycobacteroides abscessus]|nr:hypothetical protein DDJ39_09705 [Mycobacteroides abscessus]RIU19730.1 hypothetical protein D2E97_00530 [Mycobacteroides abscessus]
MPLFGWRPLRVVTEARDPGSGRRSSTRERFVEFSLWPSAYQCALPHAVLIAMPEVLQILSLGVVGILITGRDVIQLSLTRGGWLGIARQHVLII